MDNDHKTCGNCRHWGIAKFGITVTIPDDGPLGQLSVERAPCLLNAIEPDAGDGAVVLLGPESHCRCHSDAWEPVDGFDGDDESPETYGVRAGVNFPATLRR